MMMIIGDHHRPNPTVQIPTPDSWYGEDPTAQMIRYEKAFAALHRYAADDAAADVTADAYSCDDFRMFEFKVRRCAVARSHDWTECPFAHPGEKARRRDPRRHRYSGVACPDFRRDGECGRGDACEHAHGVFEAWLHPARYRTQPCKDGARCRRRVCFFAHTPEQLRVLPAASPEAASPPLSPPMRSLQLNETKSGLGLGRGLSLSLSLSLNLNESPPSWAGLGISSPPTIRPGFMSLPTTPIPAHSRPGLSPWGASCEEEPVMERVESGRELREKIYAKIGKENSLDRVVRVDSTGSRF